jgi:hypothetical protein
MFILNDRTQNPFFKTNVVTAFYVFMTGLLNASAQDRRDAAERQKNLSVMLLEITRDERDCKRLMWSNKLQQSRAALQTENFRKEAAQAERDEARLKRDLAQKNLDLAP